MRQLMFLIAAWLVMSCAAVAQSQQWRLGHADLRGSNGRSSFYIYVPKAQAWTGARVSVHVSPTTLGRLNVLIDDRMVGGADVSDATTVQFDLGPLDQGFHELRFESISRDPSGLFDPDYHCIEPPLPAMRLTDINVKYGSVVTGPVRLADIKELFYNPRKTNRDHALVGGIRIAPEFSENWPDTYAALAAMFPAIGDQAIDIIWRPFDAGRARDFDFIVSMLPLNAGQEAPTLALKADYAEDPNDPTQQRMPELVMQFGDMVQLGNLVRALAGPDYLAQLTASQARFDWSVDPLPTPMLRQTFTLYDLGVTDGRVGALNGKSQNFPIPQSINLNGLINGTVVVRHPRAITELAIFEVWINDQLAGSTLLNSANSNRQETELPIETTLPRDANSLNLRFGLAFSSSGECRQQTDAQIWMDTERSPLHLPIETANGLQGMISSLAARPWVELEKEPSAEAGALAVSLMWYAARLFEDGLAPALVLSKEPETRAPDDETATLSIQQGTAEFAAVLAKYQGRLHQEGHQDGVFLELTKRGFVLTAENPKALALATTNMPDVIANVPMDLVAAYVTGEGTLVPLQQRVTTTTGVSVRTGDLLWVYLAAAILLVSIIVTAVTLVRRSRRVSEQ